MLYCCIVSLVKKEAYFHLKILQKEEGIHYMDKGKVIAIREGKTALGIELGSTRIKAVLIGENGTPLASGNYNWENKLVDGLWTYSVEDISCLSVKRRSRTKIRRTSY